ncbi:hypothetical protein JB92DRAFT_2888350 [Gautieria morchelliformis]|nr:hypothetical protein JB92DRAFT_2888350 [Gautieria morchelliformis]
MARDCLQSSNIHDKVLCHLLSTEQLRKRRRECYNIFFLDNVHQYPCAIAIQHLAST